MERDRCGSTDCHPRTGFNPRAPYGARLSHRSMAIRRNGGFNPRAPYGARLSTSRPAPRTTTRFNPRAPYGARPWNGGSIWLYWVVTVSIHAPRMERDLDKCNSSTLKTRFQSTRPVWSATPWQFAILVGIGLCFNPRAPYGARHERSRAVILPFCFNPRAPYGARLRNRGHCIRQEWLVSIHAPRMERDDIAIGSIARRNDMFQSTRPVWSATMRSTCSRADGCTVSIHAPRMERDRPGCRLYRNPLISVSIHAPRMERD